MSLNLNNMVDTRTLIAYTKMSYQSLMNYQYEAIIHGPSIRGRKGRGLSSLWKYEDVLELELLKLMRKMDVSLAIIQKTLNHLRLNEYMLTASYIIIGDKGLRYVDNIQVMAFNPSILNEIGLVTFIVNWEIVIRETRHLFTTMLLTEGEGKNAEYGQEDLV